MMQADFDAQGTVLIELARPLFPTAHAISATRVREGGSTEVYRIVADDVVVFGRVLPEEGDGFAPEALVHQLLRARGLHVPDMLYVEHRNPDLDRSVMITSTIPGVSVGHGANRTQMNDVLEDAGRELAMLGQVPIDGWGWIARDEPTYTRLLADYATPGVWLAAEFAAPVAALADSGVLGAAEAERLWARFAAPSVFAPGVTAVLAHGDFDPTHIYHVGGRYTGLIDFGEIRGADPLYDLGHFAVGDPALLPALLRGYRTILPLSADALPRIAWWRLMVAARRLGRQLLRGAPALFSPDLAAVREELGEAGHTSITAHLGR